MYCLIITKNITWYSMRYVRFDYASRERHGIQRENKGRMMAVYWLINLHLSTVNLKSFVLSVMHSYDSDCWNMKITALRSICMFTYLHRLSGLIASMAAASPISMGPMI